MVPDHEKDLVHGRTDHPSWSYHGQIRPEKEVGMIVDEWGTWFEVEPGTNPGFLYQQNTMRDALVAGINLNILINTVIV